MELLTGSDEKYGSRKNGYAQRKFYVEYIDYNSTDDFYHASFLERGE